MKSARVVAVSSCKRGHLHVVLRSAAGDVAHATFNQQDWERFVRSGDDALVTRGLAPVEVAFELDERACEERQ